MKYATLKLAATAVAVYMVGTLPMWAADTLTNLARNI